MIKLNFSIIYESTMKNAIVLYSYDRLSPFEWMAGSCWCQFSVSNWKYWAFGESKQQILYSDGELVVGQKLTVIKIINGKAKLIKSLLMMMKIRPYSDISTYKMINAA